MGGYDIHRVHVSLLSSLTPNSIQIVNLSTQLESALHLKQQAGWVPEAKLSAMGAVLRAQREIALADWAAQVQALKDDVWWQAADAPPTKEERKKQEKEEREQKHKEEHEAAVARAEAADKAMTPEERKTAAAVQLTRQAEQEDAEEEKLLWADFAQTTYFAGITAGPALLG
eukprot:COSAG01_NODE_371_length_18005_cov_18.710153_2_plen_172_part_00